MSVQEHTLKIRVFGIGGQGIQFSLKTLGYAATIEGKYASTYSSYGAEVRGGPVLGDIVISEEDIVNPYFKHPNVAYIIHPKSNFSNINLKHVNICIADNTLRQILPATGNRIFLPILENAYDVGGLQYSSIIAISTLCVVGVVSKDSLLSSLKSLGKLDEGNIMAIERGIQMSMEHNIRELWKY